MEPLKLYEMCDKNDFSFFVEKVETIDGADSRFHIYITKMENRAELESVLKNTELKSAREYGDASCKKCSELESNHLESLKNRE